MIGISMLEFVGAIKVFFVPVNSDMATSLAFEEPCFPVFEWMTSTIWHGSPSMFIQDPSFREPSSATLLKADRTHDEGGSYIRNAVWG